MANETTKDKVLAYIKKFSAETPGFPTWVEIAKHNGKLSKAMVYRILNELNAEGHIKTLEQLRIKAKGYRLPKD